MDILPQTCTVVPLCFSEMHRHLLLFVCLLVLFLAERSFNVSRPLNTLNSQFIETLKHFIYVLVVGGVTCSVELFS